MATDLTTEEALIAVFEAAEYCVENDGDYLREETMDRWVGGIQHLQGKQVVVLTDDMLRTLKEMWDDADSYRLGEWSSEELETDEDAQADQEYRDAYEKLMKTLLPKEKTV